MAKLRSLPFPVAAKITSLVTLPPKVKAPIYNSPEFRRWRAAVLAMANGQCQAIIDGYRCTNATPNHRMYADHIIELTDGGAPFDIRNGQCLCYPCHVFKTLAARKQRYGISNFAQGNS